MITLHNVHHLLASSVDGQVWKKGGETSWWEHRTLQPTLGTLKAPTRSRRTATEAILSVLEVEELSGLLKS